MRFQNLPDCLSQPKYLSNLRGRSTAVLSLCTIALALFLLAAQKSSQTASSSDYVFGAATFQASNGGGAAAEGDFNGDGRPDLVAISGQNNSVSILLGQPNGTLVDSGKSYSVGVSPQEIAVADLNGDGKADLAVLNLVCPPNTPTCPAGSVSILLGNGDGTFQPHVDYATGAAPVAIVVGDFNGDGKLDLATTNHINPIDSGSPGTVSILRGNGDGTFQTHTDFSAGTGVGKIAAADFNNDGKLDLIITNTPSASNDAVLFMLGNGDGTFQPSKTLSIAGTPVAFATGDFNHDGNADLAVTSQPNTVSVLLGNGNGTFQARVDYPVAPFPGAIIAADLNQDQNLDLIVGVVGVLQEGGLSVLLGRGDGTFQDHADYIEGSPSVVAVADFDGDGKKDIALAGGAGSAQIVLGKGDGTLPQQVQYSLAGSPSAVAIADFNNDGKPDLVLPNCSAQCQNATLSVLLGNGDGSFQTRKDSPIAGFASFMTTGDFNGDGKQDVAVTNQQDAAITVLLGNGDGSFQPGVNYSVGDHPAGIVAGDFNQDGVLDLAVANPSDSANQPDNTVFILLGSGDGTFKPPTAFQTGPGPLRLAVGDFNRDGKLDLAVADAGTPAQGPGLVSVLLGNGDGTFQNHQDFSIDTSIASAVIVSDFNRDGILDLAVAANLDNEIGHAVILIGNGDGSFQFSTKNVYGTGLISTGIAAGDFNGDGVPDIAVPSLATSNLFLLRGKGDGLLQYQGIYGTSIHPLAVVTADLNADNLSDVVVANSSSNNVTVWISHASSPDFSLSLTPSSQTIKSGDSATYTLTATPIGGLRGTVSLSCSGNPTRSHCVVSPSTIDLSSSAGTATITVGPGSSTAAAAVAPSSRSWQTLALSLAGVLGLLGMTQQGRSSRKLLVTWSCSALLIVLVGTMASCGGIGSGPSPGTSTITIDGTSGSLQHSASATLVIK
jgi:hypothetical protein